MCEGYTCTTSRIIRLALISRFGNTAVSWIHIVRVLSSLEGRIFMLCPSDLLAWAEMDTRFRGGGSLDEILSVFGLWIGVLSEYPSLSPLRFLDGYPASFCSIKSNFRSCSSHFHLFLPFWLVSTISTCCRHFWISVIFLFSRILIVETCMECVGVLIECTAPGAVMCPSFLSFQLLSILLLSALPSTFPPVSPSLPPFPLSLLRSRLQ